MKKISKTTKTILFASLIAAMILPFSMMGMADAVSEEKEAKKHTKENLKIDVQKLLKDSKTKDFKKKIKELKKTYDKLLRESIEEVRIQTGTQKLSEYEIQDAMAYILTETVKDEKIKNILKKKSSKTANPLDVSFEDILGIQFADAACPTTIDPSYKQVSIDINGGTYGGYTFAGGNDLYIVTYNDDTSTCERTYVLYWYDEDHPYLDSYYDGLRQVWFGRTHYIESFTIKNNNTIEFDDSWSNTNDFDCIDNAVFGCHDTTTKSYSGGIVYVSNTWNHMLDTSDTNPSLSKVTVP